MAHKLYASQCKQTNRQNVIKRKGWPETMQWRYRWLFTYNQSAVHQHKNIMKFTKQCGRPHQSCMQVPSISYIHVWSFNFREPIRMELVGQATGPRCCCLYEATFRGTCRSSTSMVGNKKALKAVGSVSRTVASWKKGGAH